MQPVSVIVTAYNVEKFIRDTVHSIQAQTLADIEIIIVNDGSKDRTGQLLESISDTDSRIRLIHQDNGGVSAARNSGLAAATGEFVLFVDGDDQLLPGACDALLRRAREMDADIVVSDYVAMNEATGIGSPRSGGTFAVLTGKEFGRLLLQPFYSVAVWNKLVRRELYAQHAITFPVDISMAEDMVTLFELACRARKIVKLDEPTLIYLQRPGGLVGTVSQHRFTAAAAMDRIELLLDRYDDMSGELQDAFQTACYYVVLYTRVIHSHHYDAVHRQLYDWYQAKQFARNGHGTRRFIAGLPARERLIAHGYGVNYSTGIAMSRLTDWARELKHRLG